MKNKVENPTNGEEETQCFILKMIITELTNELIFLNSLLKTKFILDRSISFTTLRFKKDYEHFNFKNLQKYI